MKKHIYIFILVALSFLSIVQAQQKPNILFIAVDDLRPELGAYGSKIAITPNIDELAAEGLLFNNAYCQQAICGPSRASLMTGIRPESSGVYHNYIKFREANPNVLTLPQSFINNGYQTVKYGKIFHHGDKDAQSWNRPALTFKGKSVVKQGFALPENQKIRSTSKKEMFAKYGKVAKYGLAMGPAYECADVPDNAYSDGQTADLAVETIQAFAKEKGKPFFLGVGFHKPHLNWVSPKKYWDLYDRSKIKLATHTNTPLDGASMGVPPSFELRVRSGIPKQGVLSDSLKVTLKHAYLSCVSYVDAQIGKVITSLEKQGLRDNTIIILWSDHGYHLGDMGHWGKATNYEIATRVPLIISSPYMAHKNRGKKTNSLVELVDIYPTLCDLAAIKTPKTVQGKSFAKLLEKPHKTIKKMAFSVFPTPALREWGAYPVRPAMRETYFGPLLKEMETKIKNQQKEHWNKELFENNVMGCAMRTERYRVVFWIDKTKLDRKPLYVELYDHHTTEKETKNIAYENPKIVAKLYKQFKKNNWLNK